MALSVDTVIIACLIALLLVLIVAVVFLIQRSARQADRVRKLDQYSKALKEFAQIHQRADAPPRLGQK